MIDHGLVIADDTMTNTAWWLLHPSQENEARPQKRRLHTVHHHLDTQFWAETAETKRGHIASSSSLLIMELFVLVKHR